MTYVYITHTKLTLESVGRGSLCLPQLAGGNHHRLWMKCMLEASGIDVKVFKKHSVRTAAASAAHRAGASIRDILKAGN